MFLEQLIDFLVWGVKWLISEMCCPSESLQRQQEQQQQQRQLLAEHDREVGNGSIGSFQPFELQQNFEYEEFPHSVEPENENETTMLLMNAASVSIFNNNAVSATVENRSGWFFPRQSERGPLWSSIKRSFFTSVTIVLAAILLGVISCFFAYFDTETTDKCFGIEPYLNDSLPVNVLKQKLFGESFQVVLINFLFPATIALLFGREMFLNMFKSLLYIGFIMGLLVVIYKTYLFICCGSCFRNLHNRYPANAIFFIGVILGCIQIANALNESRRSILVKIGQTFLFALLMSWGFRYFIVPWFNKQTSGIKKAMIAGILPLYALLPIAIGKYVVLCHCSQFVKADAFFILIYFNYLGPVTLYRIMQAELTELRLFIAFSLLHGTFNIIAQVSLQSIIFSVRQAQDENSVFSIY